MEEVKKKKSLYVMHVAIGFAICAIFWVIPPIDPITAVGMRCVGAFLAMVYLWSSIGALWPSIFGLFMLGISGFAGDGTAGFNAVWLNAVGQNTVLLCLFGFILFGAFDEVGDTKYVAKWLMTRKIYEGKPIVFIAIFYLTCGVLCALVGSIVSLIMMWPIALRIVEVMRIDRKDTIWRFFFVGMFLSLTLMQPFFPFKGAPLIPVSAFATMTQNMGDAMVIPMVPYMITDFVMSAIIVGIYLAFIQFNKKIDLSKIKSVTPETVEKEMSLPPMDTRQKAFMWMIPAYLLMVMVPSFLPGNPICDFLNSIGAMGVTILFILVFLVIRWHGKPMLDFKEVAYKDMNWGIFFMIAAAVYAANTLSAKNTGITEFLVQSLNPILGGQPEMVFVAIMFAFALVLTNFANNAAMAVVLMPVVITFSNQIGISPIPVAMGVILMVFVAMLTPAASPHAGMMWGRTDIYAPKDILSIGLPMCAIALLSYIFIGYPLIKLLLGV